MITKKFSFGTVDIDPDEGKIWVNCPNCLLRIQNIRFNNTEEKFSMIDINGIEAFMYSGSQPEDPMAIFLETIIPIIDQKLSGKTYDDVKFALEILATRIGEELI